MNTNELLNALISRELTPTDVSRIVALYQDFIDCQAGFQQAGITLQVNIPKTTEVYPSHYIICDIADNLGLIPVNVNLFIKNNSQIKNNTGSYNKIQLIKAFRNEFHTGLADAKEAIERIYGY